MRVFNIILFNIGIQKCLKVEQRTDSTGIRHAASAALHCSMEGSKLVHVTNCTEVSMLINDVNSYRPRLQNYSFWIGNFAPGENFLDYSKKNWFEDGIVDS